MPMHYKVAELVRGVEPAPFGRFEGVEKNKGTITTPTGEGVDVLRILTERKHPNTFGLEQPHHVRNGLFTEPPLRSHDAGRALGTRVLPYVWDVAIGKVEPLGYPIMEKVGDHSRRQSGIPLFGRHRRKAAE